MTDEPLVDTEKTEAPKGVNRFGNLPPPSDLKTGTPSPPADSKPKNSRGQSASKKSPLPPWKAGAISAWVQQLYVTAGTFLKVNSDPEVAAIGDGLVNIAEPAGKAWESLAKRHEWLRRMFDKLMTTSEIGEIFWIHVPVFIPVLSKYGPFRQKIADFTSEFEAEMSSQTETMADAT